MRTPEEIRQRIHSRILLIATINDSIKIKLEADKRTSPSVTSIKMRENYQYEIQTLKWVLGEEE